MRAFQFAWGHLIARVAVPGMAHSPAPFFFASRQVKRAVMFSHLPGSKGNSIIIAARHVSIGGFDSHCGAARELGRILGVRMRVQWHKFIILSASEGSWSLSTKILRVG